MSLKNNEKLSYAIIVDKLKLRRWQFYCIKHLSTLKNIEIRYIFVNNAKKKDRKFSNIFSSFLFKPLIYYLQSIKSFEKINYNPPQVIKFPLEVKGDKKNIYFYQNKDISKIKSFKLDFILNFSVRRIKGEILNCSRLGIWSFFYGQNNREMNLPLFFWEIYHGNRIADVKLCKLSQKSKSYIILKRGLFPINFLSYREKTNQIFLESTIWPKQICLNYLNQNSYSLNQKEISIGEDFKPKLSQILVFILNFIKLLINEIIIKFFTQENWNIGFVKCGIKQYLSQNPSTLNINWIKENNLNSFYADPFIIINKNKPYIFFEKYNYKQERGEIFAYSLSDKKEFPIFKKRAHCAYPFIFEDQKKIYLIPQISTKNSINLYVNLTFPEKWEKFATIDIGFKASDTTLYKIDEYWWLFCTRSNFLPNTNLYLYYSKSLIGPWHSHPLNPVKQNIYSSRPAGSIINLDGNYLRPSQDCSKFYGSRIILNRIEKINPYEYLEKPIKILNSDTFKIYNKGMHTINSSSDYVVFDAKRYFFSIGKFKSILKSHFNINTLSYVKKLLL